MTVGARARARGGLTRRGDLLSRQPLVEPFARLGRGTETFLQTHRLSLYPKLEGVGSNDPEVVGWSARSAPFCPRKKHPRRTSANRPSGSPMRTR